MMCEKRCSFIGHRDASERVAPTLHTILSFSMKSCYINTIYV